MNIKIIVFWYVAPCSLVEWFTHFGRTCCLHLQYERRSFKVHSLRIKNIVILQLPVSLFCTCKEMYCGIISNFTNGRSNEWNSCVCITVHAYSYHRRHHSSATNKQTGLRAHDNPHYVFFSIFPLVSCDVIIFGLNVSNFHCMFYCRFGFSQPQGNCRCYIVNCTSAKWFVR